MTGKEFAQFFIDTIERVESRCMAADGPVTPTCDEITDEELRALYVAAQEIVKVGVDGWLTEQQLAEIWLRLPGDKGSSQFAHAFARAVEAAHGIGVEGLKR